MSKRIKKVSLQEFAGLLVLARLNHQYRNEPIPELGEENWQKVAFALEAPFQYAFGYTPYRGFIKKAAILFYLLAKGHRLENGNKRMACVTLNHFCAINNRELIITDEQLQTMAVRIASSNPLDMERQIDFLHQVFRVAIVD